MMRHELILNGRHELTMHYIDYVCRSVHFSLMLIVFRLEFCSLSGICE